MLRAFLTHRVTWALTGIVVLAVLLPVGLRSSDAAFVAGSTNNNSLFSSATTFNTVFTTLTDPGTPLRGSVTLDAVASSDRGISTVAFETSPAGANTWTTRCTDNAAAYSCSFNTTTVADGVYDLRVLATDSAGYSNTSTVPNRRVDNTAPTAATTSAGSPLTGVATVSGTGSDAGSGVATTTLQYRPSGGGSWTDICAQAGASVTCAWNTASLADGLYDVRTVATDVAGNTGASAIVTNRQLDNVAPTATMTNPGTPLRGTITLASTSADAANGSGVSSVRYEYRTNPSGTWSTACTSGTSPFSCSFDTSTVPADGLYDFRAVAIDGVAKEGASAAVTARRIDNTAPATAMGALSANLSGSVSLTSTISDAGTGVASAQYQYKLTSGSTWSNACAPATAPWTCSFNTASVGDGVYDFRVTATDGAGNTGTSTAVFSRRIDNTNPTVTMGSVPAWVDAAVSLTSTPADGGGIASVQYQVRLLPAGGWGNACLATTAPYSCSYNTAALPTGNSYEFRAFVTDNAGRTATSTAATSRIDHVNPAVTMTAPAANIGGSVTLASTPTDAHSGVASVQYEYRVATTGSWTSACASSSTPWTCAFDTGALADGLYDFRVTATDNVGRSATSATVTGRRVDNTDPGIPTLGAVGTPLSGNVNFTGTAADNGGGSGINNWAVQYSPAGASTWTTLCSDNATPFGCTGNVAAVADGLYDFRALATDNAGNTSASAVQVNRRIDSAGPVASITSPANNARVHDTITMVAAATDPAGVAWVRFEVQLTPGVWTQICTDTTPSYTCAGDTNLVADGTYQIRVVAQDTLGNQSISALTTLTVDNTHPTAANVQTANGGTQGRIDAGDTITFTWSEPMAPASIMTGWAGGSQAVRVYVDNNTNGTSDAIHIYDPTTNTRLNITGVNGLRLNANYVANDVYLNGTMTMAGNSITVTVGSLISGTINTNVTTSTQLNWWSSTTATDVAGNTAQGNTANESGVNDRDF